jgi:hypothetical protein
MSSESPDTATAVRPALEALRQALDDHLAEVEQRSGEQDPAVQDAYERLRNAAMEYDDALFDAYDEVTPFTFVEPQTAEPVEVATEHPQRLTLLVRVDLHVEDLARVLEAGRQARQVTATAEERLTTTGTATGAATPDNGVPEIDTHIGAALGAIVDAHGVDALREEPEEFGLTPAGSTLWVVDAIGGDLDDNPFGGIDEESLLLRDDEVYV